MAGTSQSSSSSDGLSTSNSNSNSNSFKLLCQYLNFGDDARSRNQVYLTLRSAHIRPFFEEYARDYLMEAEYVEDIGLEALLEWCKRKDAFRTKKYTSSLATTGRGSSKKHSSSRHISSSASSSSSKKASWSALDHAARFIVQTLQFSWRNPGGYWSLGRCDLDSVSASDSEDGTEFWQAWLVLRYLQSEWEADNLESSGGSEDSRDTFRSPTYISSNHSAMEPLGLGVGIAGLAGLFSTCMDCFELVQQGRYLGENYHLLETKFNNQWWRLTAWGRACGFTGDDGYGKRVRWDDRTRIRVNETLGHLLSLLQNGAQLNRKYGLAKATQTEPEKAALLTSDTWTGSTRAAIFITTIKLREIKDRMTLSSKLPGHGIAKRARWAIQDKKRFEELIQHMRDFIEDLEGMTAPLGVKERQRDLIKHDMECITEISTLESIENARVARVDTISDAASFQLCSVRDGRQPSSGVNSDDFNHQATDTGSEGDWEILPEASLVQNPVDMRFQRLYRVHCDLSQTSTFFDIPDYTCSDSGNDNECVFLDMEQPYNSSRSFHLCGKRQLHNLEAYLAQNTQLEFVVFQEYRCHHDRDDTNLSATTFGQSIYIASENLCAELRSLLKSFSTPCPLFETKAELPFPYYWHYHLRSHDVHQESASVCTFWDFIEKSMAAEYPKVDDQKKRKVVSWECLPYLFICGDMIVHRGLGLHAYQVYRLDNQPQFTQEHTGDMQMRFTASSIGVSGQLLLNQTFSTFKKFGFSSPSQEREYSKLPILPLWAVEEMDMEILRTRGEKLLAFGVPKLVSYTGLDADSGDVIKNERLMVDIRLWWKRNGDTKVSSLTSSDEVEISFKASTSISADTMLSAAELSLLAPPTVFAFDLVIHRWRRIYIDHIKEVNWNRGVFNNLNLEREKKEMLESMVLGARRTAASHISSSPVILFHGQPGVGKTFAAEAVAELAQMALLRITPRKIGSTVQDVQNLVTSTLALTRCWDCVLLLKQADIYLEPRNTSDVFSNAVANEFNNLIDAYKGIIVLTSSCANSSGNALNYRATIVISFSLDYCQQRHIWENLVYQLYRSGNESTKEIDVDKFDLVEMVEQFYKYSLNGRQMHGLIANARRLAAFEEERLHMRHFQKIIKYEVASNRYIEQADEGNEGNKNGKRWK
ncbi:AAA family ATPase [Apiospora sp. TS-2023a]